MKYKEQLLAFIESGKTFVATGFAEALLYKSFKMLDGVTYEGIGLIDAEAEEFDGLYVSDALLAPAFAPEERVFGTYYNFAKVSYNKNESPLFEVLKADAGEGAVSGTEGFCYKNLFATRCLGPLFVRNPNMMKKLLKTVLGPDYAETDFSLEEKAQAKLIEEMK